MAATVLYQGQVYFVYCLLGTMLWGPGTPWACHLQLAWPWDADIISTSAICYAGICHYDILLGTASLKLGRRCTYPTCRIAQSPTCLVSVPRGHRVFLDPCYSASFFPRSHIVSPFSISRLPYHHGTHLGTTWSAWSVHSSPSSFAAR